MIHSALECFYAGQHDREALGVPFSTFSEREWQVCEYLDGPQGEKTIAAELGSSPHTLHCHVKSIYRKLNVRSRLEVIDALKKARGRYRRGAIHKWLGKEPWKVRVSA